MLQAIGTPRLHIQALPAEVRQSPGLRQACKALYKVAQEHRICQAGEADAGDPHIAAQLEGQEMQALLHFRDFMLEKVLPTVHPDRESRLKRLVADLLAAKHDGWIAHKPCRSLVALEKPPRMLQGLLGPGEENTEGDIPARCGACSTRCQLPVCYNSVL